MPIKNKLARLSLFLVVENVKFVYNVVYERYTKDDVPHLRRVSSSLDYDMEHASMRFNNLFNGNKQLGRLK